MYLADRRPRMILEGVVSNVAAFGAFVDIGVHQDGLIHISALSDTFVKDPREVVKAGDIVKVRVLEVDLQRKRIALTRRLDESTPAARGPRDDRGTSGGPRNNAPRGGGRDAGRFTPPRPSAPATNGAMAEAFAKAKRGG